MENPGPPEFSKQLISRRQAVVLLLITAFLTLGTVVGPCIDTGTPWGPSAGDCGPEMMRRSSSCWSYDDGEGQATTPDGVFTSVSAGELHNCGVRPRGSIKCWGYNSDGQAEPPPSSFVSVSAGTYHTCGVRTDGAVECWGWNGEGQAEPPDGSFISVSAGYNRSCGVRTDGSVECWGRIDDESRPPSGLFTSVSIESFHGCGVKTDGSVECWGGDGETNKPSDGSFVSVSAGRYHTCGITTNGSVECWGGGTGGQCIGDDSNPVKWDCWTDGFGYGDVPGRAEPSDGSFISVASGWSHSCGVKTDGSVVCWGAVAYDQHLGRRDMDEVVYGRAAKAVYGGDEPAYSRGWRGWDQYGQASPPSGSFVSVSASSKHSCGVKTDGSVDCWGGGFDDRPKY